jgi:hypothetical protein
VGPVLACAAEACLAIAWYLLSEPGSAPGLAMTLWIWPLVFAGCFGVGLWLRPRTRATANPFQPSVTTSMMIRSLAAQTLLFTVPAVVMLYACAAVVIALRVG